MCLGYFYFRSLKFTIVLHTGIDFFAALEFGLFEGVSASQLVSTYSPLMIIPHVVLFIAWLGYSKLYNIKKCVQRDTI